MAIEVTRLPPLFSSVSIQPDRQYIMSNCAKRTLRCNGRFMPLPRSGIQSTYALWFSNPANRAVRRLRI